MLIPSRHSDTVAHKSQWCKLLLRGSFFSVSYTTLPGPWVNDKAVDGWGWFDVFFKEVLLFDLLFLYAFRRAGCVFVF